MSAPATHRTELTVRGYEIDALGHVRHTVYLDYAEHARWEALAAAGLSAPTLLQHAIMPIMLETTISYRRELRYDDVVAVGCEFEWGTGKTARITQPLTRVEDGTVAAEVRSVSGLLDLTTRTLVADPLDRLCALATDPEVLGLGRVA
ncbi:acyl-CoA thioesterase [Pseudonocardia pini]|uniref:acyl-CoA thioesterase n=1 Tax=Pseudonocardia pini TaxID=2758030 RepID=UPI0015F004C9|nr:acyl-CoA thioesterase [Pseudonocardia pini]